MTIEDHQGRPVRLPYERWQHICARHPEMDAMMECIHRTVTQPDVVVGSESDPETVILYQKQFPGSTLGNGWVRVAVKYLEDDAFILTAFVIGRIN